MMTSIADPLVSAEHRVALEHQLREKVINEEFKIWKKTVPLLYSTIYTHALKWPSLTVDFSAKYSLSEDKTSINVPFVIGSNTSSREQDVVSIASVSLPSTLASDFTSFSNGDSILIAADDAGSDSFQILQQWNHPGEANRAKFAPAGEKFVTFDNTGTVHLYRLGQENSIDFKSHSSEGYCLEWISDNEFLSGANDTKIFLWRDSTPASPVAEFASHSAVINDISFSKASKVLFGSVSDDFSTQIHDLRSPQDSPAIKIVEKHIQNAIQFHPDLSYLFATGGKDNIVHLYDARNTNSPLRQLFGHNDSVAGLRWNNFEPLELYSWGLDKRVITWNLAHIGEDSPYSPTEVSEGKRRVKNNDDACIGFIHAGHTNKVNDFAVHPTIPNLFASIGDDCLLEVFQPNTVQQNDENEETETGEEEEAVEEDAKEDVEFTGHEEKDPNQLENKNMNSTNPTNFGKSKAEGGEQNPTYSESQDVESTVGTEKANTQTL